MKNDEILRLIANLKSKPYSMNIGGVENDGLALLLEELIERRDIMQTIGEMTCVVEA